MKVLHIIGDLDTGGAQAVLTNLVLGDSHSTHIVVCLGGEGVFGKKLKEREIDVVELGINRQVFSAIRLLKLFRILWKSKPDVVQTWMYHSDLIGGLVTKLSRVAPVCWGIHNSNLSTSVISGNTRLVVKSCSFLSSWVPSRIISCSKYAKDIHIGIGYEPNKFDVVFNGYDVKRFKPTRSSRQEIRGRLGLPKEAVLIGMVARWHPVKDHRTLFAAFSSIEDKSSCRLVLVGPGMVASNVELLHLLGSFGLFDRCELLGERSDLPETLGALDMHVLSSRGEAFPNAVAEAMSCGVPGISTDVGDAAFILDDTGIVVPPEDPAKLASAIQRMINITKAGPGLSDVCTDPDHLHAKIADRFSEEAMVLGYRKIWKSVSKAD